MKTKGFTLVELLVVIAILAILATVSVVGYTSFINDANESIALQEMTQLRDALKAEDITNNKFDLSDGLTADEVTEIKTFVATLKMTGAVNYDTTNGKISYSPADKDVKAEWVVTGQTITTSTGKVTAN